MHLDHSYQHFVLTPILPSVEEQIKDLSIKLPDKLSNANEKRKTEFLLGRYCAFQALKKCGYNDELNLPIGKDGGPVWPSGYCGSITHCDGLVKSVVAESQFYRSLGLDSQPTMNQKTFSNIHKKIMTPYELTLEIVGLSKLEIATLIFSAKESIYKCLRPVCNRFFGFYAAEITKFDLKNGILDYKLCESLSESLLEGHQGQLLFKIENGIIHTLTWLKH